MKRTLGIAAASAGIALAAAACGSSATTTSSSQAGTAGTTNATLSFENTNTGPILVDGKGRTVYLFMSDSTSTSTCNGACAAGWPPLTVTGKPTVGSGLSASLVGTTKRSDGSTEVTYNGHPLYYFSGDSAPGQVGGQNVSAFGDKWYVLTPNGTPVLTPSILVMTAGTGPSQAPSTGSGGGGY